MGVELCGGAVASRHQDRGRRHRGVGQSARQGSARHGGGRGSTPPTARSGDARGDSARPASNCASCHRVHRAGRPVEREIGSVEFLANGADAIRSAAGQSFWPHGGIGNADAAALGNCSGARVAASALDLCNRGHRHRRGRAQRDALPRVGSAQRRSGITSSRRRAGVLLRCQWLLEVLARGPAVPRYAHTTRRSKRGATSALAVSASWLVKATRARTRDRARGSLPASVLPIWSPCSPPKSSLCRAA
jgi:hypothetical protein